MQRTKRPTELKIVFKKKTLINTNFWNASEYVTVKDLGELFRGKYFGKWDTLPVKIVGPPVFRWLLKLS